MLIQASKLYFMIKCIGIFAGLMACCFHAVAQTPFYPGNLVVYRIGDGSDTLSSAGFPVFADEFTTSGSAVASHPLPVTINGLNRRIIASGSATSEGMISRSTDKAFLLVTGYDTFPDPNRSSISGSQATLINRVVGLFGADGSIDSRTALADAYNGSNIRGAVSTNGTDIWITGTGSPVGTAGIRYVTRGATTSLQLSTTVTNIRNGGLFNNQLYCTSGSGAFKGISAVGTGMPTTAGQTITVLPGFPNTTAAGPDPYAFEINPAGTIAYVADGRSKAAGGGVQRWDYNGASWSLSYTLDSGLTLGVRYLTVDWSNSNPVIYAVTSDAIVKNQPGNRIVKTTDTDSLSAFVAIAQAGANTVYRGICFTPEGGTSITYTFTGNGNWTDPANWSGNTVPPNPLLSGHVVIDPVIGGQCVVNLDQTIGSLAKFTVMTGKKLIIPGNLIVL